MLHHAAALGWFYIESEQTACLLSQMERHRKETVFNAQVGEGGTARLEPIRMVFKSDQCTLRTSALLSSNGVDLENAAQSNFRWLLQQMTRCCWHNWLWGCKPMMAIPCVPCFVGYVSEELITDICKMFSNVGWGRTEHTQLESLTLTPTRRIVKTIVVQ